MVAINVDEQTAKLLRERAAAMGVSVAEYVKRVATLPPRVWSNRIMTEADFDRQRFREAFDRFVALGRELTAKLPPGQVVDDSRERIYE